MEQLRRISHAPKSHRETIELDSGSGWVVMGPPSKRASRRRGGGQVHLPVPATSPPFPSGKIDRQVEQMECRGNTRRCFGWKDFAILLEWRFDPPFRSDPFRISRNFGERKEGRKTSRDSSLLHKCMARIGVIIRWKETRVESVSNFIGRIFRHDTFFFFFRRERMCGS